MRTVSSSRTRRSAASSADRAADSLPRALGAQLAGRHLRGALQVARDDRRHALLDLRLAPHRLAHARSWSRPRCARASRAARPARRPSRPVAPRPARHRATPATAEYGPPKTDSSSSYSSAVSSMSSSSDDVVAHHDERAAPSADHLGEPRPRVAVEVVGRLVEQDDGCRAQPDAGDRGEHRLAARQLADAAVEHVGREAGLGERGVRARLDVPVGADRVEVTRVDVAGLDRAQRGERLRDAEQLGDGPIDVERQPLRQVGDIRRRRDVARSGRRARRRSGAAAWTCRSRCGRRVRCGRRRTRRRRP